MENLRVLIADDDPIIRLDLKQMLETLEYEVVAEAGDGKQAVEKARETKPDVCILDVKMPVMDGVTMLGKLKADAAIKHIPVIMLTAESGRENVAHIARLGVRDYLVKPFKEDQLLEKAGRIVKLAPKPAAAEF